ncbi:hypothetical protein CRENBAI_018210 [Crenichthys baileyi]|uniref:Carbonic anhydrase n=1 Tax=Crenichthys baileyi TaxID=28760 RepID=A0AAV9SHG7_9TELE
MAFRRSWLLALLLVLLCPLQPPHSGIASAQDVSEEEEDVHTRHAEEVVAEEGETAEGGEDAEEDNEVGSKEDADDDEGKAGEEEDNEEEEVAADEEEEADEQEEAGEETGEVEDENDSEEKNEEAVEEEDEAVELYDENDSEEVVKDEWAADEEEEAYEEEAPEVDDRSDEEEEDSDDEDDEAADDEADGDEEEEAADEEAVDTVENDFQEEEAEDHPADDDQEDEEDPADIPTEDLGETNEEEETSDKQQFHSSSLCSICSICEHCTEQCDKCPCAEGDKSDHCEHCEYLVRLEVVQEEANYAHTASDSFAKSMHIVTAKTDVPESEILEKEDGLAVLGFFINATEDINMSEPWLLLTSYLANITDVNSKVELNHNIYIGDLIGQVDLSKFYRYMGSLTTPDCNQAVVWTLFHEPIQVHKGLLQRFPKETKLSNNYRPVQPLNGRHITASPATPLPPDFTPSLWSELPHSHCSGENQSPIDIDTQSVLEDKHLSSFTFTNFDNKHAIKSITNKGHTVECILEHDLVEVSGGGLEHVYSTLQFHFHWGTESTNSVGSEHTVDSKRYPMELHIVNKRKDLTLDEAVQTPDGLAVLGFFIEPPQSTKSASHSVPAETAASTPASTMDAWKTLTLYLSAIRNISSEVEFTDEISIDDLLGNVNRESYFRYNGSLTTPMCNEAVVWTVFKESVTVDHYLLRSPIKCGANSLPTTLPAGGCRLCLLVYWWFSVSGARCSAHSWWLLALSGLCLGGDVPWGLGSLGPRLDLLKLRRLLTGPVGL